MLNTFSNKFTPSETFSSPTKKETLSSQLWTLPSVIFVQRMWSSAAMRANFFFSSAHIFFFITLSLSPATPLPTPPPTSTPLPPPNPTPAGPIKNTLIRAVAIIIIMMMMMIIDKPQTLTNTKASPSPAVFCGWCTRRRQFICVRVWSSCGLFMPAKGRLRDTREMARL